MRSILTVSRDRPSKSRSVRNASLKVNNRMRPSKSPSLIKRKVSASGGSRAEIDKAGFLRNDPSYEFVCWIFTAMRGFWKFLGRKEKDASSVSGKSARVSCASCDESPTLLYLQRLWIVIVPVRTWR